MNKLLSVLFLFSLLIVSCDPATESATDSAVETAVETVDPNKPTPGVKYKKDGKTHLLLEAQPWPKGNGVYPAAPGFNAAASDDKAIRLADSIVRHHGGYEAYANAKDISWTFFGTRQLKWDKQGSRVRIDVPEKNTTYLLNFAGDTLTGRVKLNGNEIRSADSLATYLKQAYSIFNNDSYWLFHQFKLKDTGVTLKYGGEVRVDPLGKRPCHILDMTFEDVGDTPQNRYRLYVDKVTFRINTWQFFRDAADEEPAMETPWLNYLPYDGLVLSDDRGGRYQLGPVGVNVALDRGTFTEF